MAGEVSAAVLNKSMGIKSSPWPFSGYPAVAGVGESRRLFVANSLGIIIDDSISTRENKPPTGHGLPGSVERQAAREGLAMGRLSGHPHIENILQVGVTESNRPYIVTPYHAAGSLAQRLHRVGRIAWPDALRIAVKLCGALVTAHRTGTLAPLAPPIVVSTQLQQRLSVDTDGLCATDPPRIKAVRGQRVRG
jgi:serine/threonine protein kinase